MKLKRRTSAFEYSVPKMNAQNLLLLQGFCFLPDRQHVVTRLTLSIARQHHKDDRRFGENVRICDYYLSVSNFPISYSGLKNAANSRAVARSIRMRRPTSSTNAIASTTRNWNVSTASTPRTFVRTSSAELPSRNHLIAIFCFIPRVISASIVFSTINIPAYDYKYFPVNH